MSETTKQQKKWKTGRVFNSFLEADEFRKTLLEQDLSNMLLVKARRCGDGGSKFKIKTWTPPAQKKKIEDKKSNKNNNKPTRKKKNTR